MAWPRHEPYGRLPAEDNYGYHHHPPPSEIERTRHPSFEGPQYHMRSPSYYQFDNGPSSLCYRPRFPAPSYSRPPPPPVPSYHHEPHHQPPSHSYLDSPHNHSHLPPPQPLFPPEDTFNHHQHHRDYEQSHPFPPYHQDNSFSHHSFQPEWYPGESSALNDPVKHQRDDFYSPQEESDFTDHSHFSDYSQFSSPSGPQPTFERLKERSHHPSNRYPSPVRRRERRHSTSSSDCFQHSRSSYSHPPHKHYNSEEKRSESRHDNHRSSVFKRLEPHKTQSSAPSQDVPDPSKGSVLHRLGPVILPGSLPPQSGRPSDLREELDTRQASSLSVTPPSSSQLLVRIKNSARTSTGQNESEHHSSWNGIFSHADNASSHDHLISSPLTVSPIMSFPKERFNPSLEISKLHDTSVHQDGLLSLPQQRSLSSASSPQCMPDPLLPSNTEKLSSSGHKLQLSIKSARKASDHHHSDTSDYKESVESSSSSQIRSLRSSSSQSRSSVRHKQHNIGEHEKSRSSTRHGRGSIHSSSSSTGKRQEKRSSLSPIRSNAKRSNVSRVEHSSSSTSSIGQQRAPVSRSSDSSLAKTPTAPVSASSSQPQVKVVKNHDELSVRSSKNDSLSAKVSKTPLLTHDSNSDSSSKQISSTPRYSLRALEMQRRPPKSVKVVSKAVVKASTSQTASPSSKVSPVSTVIDSATSLNTLSARTGIDPSANLKVGMVSSSKRDNEICELNSENVRISSNTAILAIPSSPVSSALLPPASPVLSNSDIHELAHKVIIELRPGLFERLHMHALPFAIDGSLLIILWKSVNTIYSAIVARSGCLDNLQDLSDYCIGAISLRKTLSCSAIDLYKEELIHLHELCGTSINLWMYHILRHYTLVLGYCNTDNSFRLVLKGIVDSLVCVMDELQPSSFSCSSLPDDSAHSIARELYNDAFVHQLVVVPLPGFSSTTIFAVLYNATVHALTCLRHHPSSSGPFFSNALTEFAIGSVANEVTDNPSARLPSPDTLYQQELSSLYERCGENCPLWRCLVMKYWALVRYSPAPTVNMVSKQIEETKSLEEAIKSDLELAELMFRILHDMPLQTTTHSLSTSTLPLTTNDQQSSHLSDSDDLIIVDSPVESAPSYDSSFCLFVEDRKPDLSLLRQEFSESQPSEMVNKEEDMVLCIDEAKVKEAQKTSFSPIEPESSHRISQEIPAMESSQVLMTSSPSSDISAQPATLNTNQLVAGKLHVDKPSSLLSSVVSPPNIQSTSPLLAENIQKPDKSPVTTASMDTTRSKNDMTTHPTSLQVVNNPASVPQEQESPEPGEILSDEDGQKDEKKAESIQKPSEDQRKSRQTRVDFSPVRVRSSPRKQQHSPHYSSSRKSRYNRGHSEHRPKRRSRSRKHSNDDLELEKLRKEALESRSKVRKTALGSDSEEKGESSNMLVQHKPSKHVNVSVDAEQTNQVVEENKSTASVEVSPRSVGLSIGDDRVSDNGEGKCRQTSDSDSPKLSIVESPQAKACSPLLQKSSNSSPKTPLTSHTAAFKPIQLSRTVSLPISSGLDGDERTVGKRAKLAGSRVGSPYDSPVRSPSVSSTSCSSVKVVTNKNTTWKVEAFTIAVSQDEEDDVDHAFEKPGKEVNGQQQVSIAEINEMIKSCRQEAEAKVLPADSQSEDTMAITSPVLEMLPAKQQKEYHHLRKKLIAAQQQQKRQQAVASQKKRIALSLANRKRSSQHQQQQIQAKKQKLQSFCEGLKQDELLLSSLTSALNNCKATITEQSSQIKHLMEELKSAENNLLATQKKQLLLGRKVEEISERVTKKRLILPKLQQQLDFTEESNDSCSSDQSPERMQQPAASTPVEHLKETSNDSLELLENVSVASRDNTESCDPNSEHEDGSVNITDNDVKPKNTEKLATGSGESMTVVVSEMICENEQEEKITDKNDEDSDTGSVISEKNMSPSKRQTSSSTAAVTATPSSPSLLNKSSDALPSKSINTRQSNSSLQRKLLQRVVEGQRQIQKVKESLIAVLDQATTSKPKTGSTTDSTPPSTEVVKLPSNSSSKKLVLKEKTREGLHRVLGALGVQESNFDEILAKVNDLNLYELFLAMLPDTDPLCPLTSLHLATGLVMDQLLSPPDDSCVISEVLLLKALEKTEPKSIVDSNSLNSTELTSYMSPLLTFQSYRLKPYFRTQFNLSLSSPTYSHRVHPEHVMCRFELIGRCFNSQCSAQHLSDIFSSTDQILADISSYQSTSENSQDSPQDKLKNFRGKVSDDELLQLAAHSTRERLLKMSGSSSLSCSSLTQPPPAHRNKNNMEDESSAEGEVPPVLVISSDSSALPLNSQYSTKGMLRYWDSPPQDQPSDSHCQEKTPETSQVKYASEEEYWVNYIPKKAASIAANTPSLSASLTKYNEEITTLDQLFDKAVSTCPSYPVLSIVISNAPTIASKHQWIEEAVHLITEPMIQSTSDHAVSHSVLQLLLSAIALHLETGCIAEAIKLLKISARGADNEQSNSSVFRGLLSLMTLDDKLFLCHCYLYLVAFSSLPPCFSCRSIPVKLTNKQLFIIPWNKATMTPSKKKEIFDIFKVFQLACLDKSLPQSVGFARCSDFYVTFVLFEYCHSSVTSALRCLQRLLNVVPSSSMLSLLYIQLVSASDTKEDAWEHLKASLESCPKDPLLYYLAARLELKQHSQDDKSSIACAKAVNWLELCIKSYYDINISDTSSLDHHDLYRHLLGLSIPYDYTPPVLSETLSPENRRNQLAPLWLCYCLFVELTRPLSPDDSDEAYESAIHSLSDNKIGLELLWWCYLVMKMEAACKRSATVQSVKQFLDCAQRCLLVFEDQSMSNDSFLCHQIIKTMLRCVPLSLRFKTLHSTVLVQPYSSLIITRLAECTWKSDHVDIDLTQSVLATYLSQMPSRFSLWIVAIVTELRQHHYREARWLFVQASKHHPFNRQLWIEFMLFEMKCMMEGVHSDSQLQTLLTRCQQVNVSWMKYFQQYLATLAAASNKKFVRPVQNRLNLWGTVSVSYGGIGKSAIELKPTTNCCTSRSHGHFGTGCINSNAPDQPYRLTSLLLSKCRPNDQILPLPLMSNLIHERKLKCPCPKYSSTTLHSSYVSPLSTQDKQISSHYSSTYRRDYQNYWNSSYSENKPENNLRSVNSDTDQMVNDTASVTEEADEANEVTIDMVDNQEERKTKEMATQTDLDLAVVVCAWEKNYDSKSKKDYVCSSLQLEQSSSMKHTNDKKESSPTLNKGVQTLPLVHLPLVQYSKALSFSQLPPTSRSTVLKLPELSDCVCQTSDIETHRIAENFNLTVTAKPQILPHKTNEHSCNLQRLHNTLHPETAPSYSLTRREGKRQFFCGYHSSVFRG